jgi:predicted RNA polymerase sigma factor
VTVTAAHRTIDAIWRIESAKLIAGIPDNPGAWLMATAKHRAIDH